MSLAPTAAPAVAFRRVERVVWRRGLHGGGARSLAEETPVALSYDGTTYAVLLATPHDLDDFALGFSLNEGIVAGADEIDGVDIVDRSDGIELRIELVRARTAALAARRRRLAGPSGCGLCGIASLHEAARPVAPVRLAASFTPQQIQAAVAALGEALPLGAETRAVHAAALWQPRRGLVAVREDVGRHNALDKLAGALGHGGVAVGDGIVVLTSRISIELVQKAARMGAAVVVAMSAPTALAVRAAEAAGMTLVGVARDDGFELFTRRHRVDLFDPHRAAAQG